MTNLNFWVLANSGIHTASHLNALLAEFERENPKISVEISVLNRSALWRRLFSCLQEARECEPADVVQIPHYWTALFGRLGFFEDLAELDPKISLRDWLEPLRPHCTLHQTGRIYSLPWWMDATALHYRADHLAQITKEPEEALSKWDGFLKICAELSRKKRPAGYYPLENSNLRGLASCRDVLPRVWARGGDILTPDGTRATLLRDEFLRGVDDYLSLFRKGLMPLLRERGSLGTMLEGKASMTISRRRAPAPPPEAGAVEVRTLPVPGGLFGSHAYLSSYNLAVSKESARSKEALSLVKWLCRDDSQAKYSQLIGAFTSEGLRVGRP